MRELLFLTIGLGGLGALAGCGMTSSTPPDLAPMAIPDASRAIDLAAPPTVDLSAPTDSAADAMAGADLSPGPDLEIACASICQGPTPVCDAQTGQCVACLPSNDVCSKGLYCAAASDGGAGFACAPGCNVDGDCPNVGVAACCNHKCTDLSSDSGSCGKCGASCGNKACCSSACIDTTADIKNCGACGNACAMVPSSMIACVKSACAVTGCTAPYADCNMNASDGCEANVMTDLNNCLACGKICNFTNGQGACNGGCVLASCYAGYADCNHNVNDGCEVQVTQDPNNCGACGKVCPAPPNSTGSCMGGACGVGGCSPGFGDCDGNVQNGCEANLKTEIANCGACGTSCAKLANATGTCTAGACAIVSCTAPFQNCNNMSSDGCESNSKTDVNNCGACGTTCPAVANATIACTNGACGIGVCSPGFSDCNKLANDGCEVATGTDKNNCGACGNVCPNNVPFCNAGVCSAQLPTSCLAILNGGGGNVSGLYTVSPDGVTSFQVYCDMTSAGGGWTAFFVGINGSPNVFAHFEDVAVMCANPATQCLRRLPASATVGTQFLAECGNSSVMFNVNQAAIGYLRDGVQGGGWEMNSNVVSVAGNVNPNAADEVWTGSANNKGFIVGDQNGGARIFMSSYNLNAGWDSCNGNPDTASPIKFLYR